MARIILASGSPRRRMILEQVGLEFEVIPSEVDESMSSEIEGDPVDFANCLALKKVKSVSNRVEEGIIVAADTVVALDGRILGKPGSRDDAVDMLRSLSGRSHEVVTCLVVMDADCGKTFSEHVTTKVKFRTLRDEEILAYVETGEAFDKAGGYGIQGKASVFIESIEGCFYNVVGMPLTKLSQLLKRFGIHFSASQKLGQRVKINDLDSF